MGHYLALFLLVLSPFYGQILPEKKLFQYPKLFSTDTANQQENLGMKFYYFTELNKETTEQSLYLNPFFNTQLNQNWNLHVSYLLIPSNQPGFSSNYFSYRKYNQIYAFADASYLTYRDETFYFKIGRFTDKIGASPIDNLLLGNHDYHDGFKNEINYKNFTFNQRFFQLSALTKNLQIKRYLYQHGIKYQGDSWTASVNEVAVTAAYNATLDFALINPFALYYAEQHNNQKELNALISFDFLYHFPNGQTWLEILIDDFQLDSKDNLSNREPNQFGFQLGAHYQWHEHLSYLNVTLIRNRTYNDPGFQDETLPQFSFMKYLDHNQIIGYPLGSNLVRTELLYGYRADQNLSFYFYLDNLLQGNESVIAEFDSSYYGIAKDAFEPIPFGKIHNRFSWSIITSYQFKYLPLSIFSIIRRNEDLWSLNFQLKYEM